MSGLYLTWLADVLRGAGCGVVEYDGWQNRARSSGGYADMPLAVMWHHTASNTSPANDASYMCHGSSDRPIANLLIARTGEVWVLAAGATNTNGKGNALTFSRGTVPTDSMNTRALGCEIQNTGVGEQYGQAQVDAMFRVSNACNAMFGNVPGDVATHNLWAPTRKIDPATTDVAGPWQPTASTSSGTWDTDDIRDECERRSLDPVPPPVDPPPPDPIPDPDPEDWLMTLPTIKKGDSGPAVKRMQHLLAAAGYMNEANTSNYDGVWGNGTDGAKQRFDVDHGLTPSPPTDCGDKSWRALNGA